MRNPEAVPPVTSGDPVAPPSVVADPGIGHPSVAEERGVHVAGEVDRSPLGIRGKRSAGIGIGELPALLEDDRPLGYQLITAFRPVCCELEEV